MSAATVKKNRESTLKGARWWKEVGWRHIVAILMIIYCLIPLLYVLSVSLNPGATLTGSTKLFSSFSFENFLALGSGKYAGYWSWVLNSLIVSTATAVGTVLMGAAAAYAFLGDFDGLRLGDGAGMFVRCRRGGQAAGNECGGNGKQGEEA